MRKNDAQAIVVAGFVIAIGIVTMVVILNGIVFSVSLEELGTQDDGTMTVNFHNTMVRESRQAIEVVNNVSAIQTLNNSQVNQTYVNYVETLKTQIQNAYTTQGIVDIENLSLTNFQNGWRIRKNQTTPPSETIRAPFDVSFVLDTSGSMETCTDSGDKCTEMIEATKTFVSSMKPKDRMSLVTFASTSGYGTSLYDADSDGDVDGYDDNYNLYDEPRGIFESLMPAVEENKDDMNSTLENLSVLSDTSSSTYLGGGLREGLREMRRNAKNKKYIIALTDGENTEGWVHFNNRYVYSCVQRDYEDTCNEDKDWKWRHEWGLVSGDAWGSQYICISKTRGDDECDRDDDNNGLPDEVADLLTNDAWDYTDSYDNYDEEMCAGTPDNWKCFEPLPEFDETSLNERDLMHARRAANNSVIINTVGLGDEDGNGDSDNNDAENGCFDGDLNACHLRDVANEAGGSYYPAEDANELESVFESIYNTIAKDRPIAKNISNTYRVNLEVKDFLRKGNVTLTAVDSSGGKVWQMNVTNRTTASGTENQTIVINDGGSVLEVYNYSDFGTPLDIEVMQNEVNNFDLNLRSDLLKNADNYTMKLSYNPAVANVTYDIRVGEKANVSVTPCGSAPCGGPSNQSVGFIRRANFTVQFKNEDITFEKRLSLTPDYDLSVASPATGGSSISTPKTKGRVLGFSTPVYEYDVYYPFDDEYGGKDNPDESLDEHAFDASLNNNTAGLMPRPPAIQKNSPAISGLSYQFDAQDYIIDEDGWNEIPVRGAWTISFWVRNENTGAMYDNSINRMLNGGPYPSYNKHFYVANTGSKLIWEYEDRSDTDVTLSYKDSGFLGDLLDGGWNHIAVVGRWNASANESKLFIDGKRVDKGDSSVSVGRKPLQQPVTTDGVTTRINSTVIGANAVDYSTQDEDASIDGLGGYTGYMDDVRIYHKDLSGGTKKVPYIDENFDENNGSFPAGWSNYSDGKDFPETGLTDETFSSGSYSAFTCCSSDAQITSPGVNASEARSVVVRYWVKKGAGFSDPPESGENLKVQYNNSGSWITVDEIKAGSLSNGEEVTRKVELPPNATHSSVAIRFKQTGGSGDGKIAGGKVKSNPKDFWYIDDVRVVGKVPNNWIKEIYQQGVGGPGGLNTPWKKFDTNVSNASLKLTNINANEANDGEVVFRVQSDIDDDGTPDETSDPINYDEGTATYNVTGLTTNNEKFRLEIVTEHPEPKSIARVFSADLEAPS